MTGYARRLDTLEQAMLPKRGTPHMVWLNAIQTEDEAVSTYAEAHGLTVADVRANMICFSWADARL